MDIIDAITEILKPVYQQYQENETLEEFVKKFMESGGNISLQVPEWLSLRMKPKDTVEEPKDFIWGKDSE